MVISSSLAWRQMTHHLIIAIDGPSGAGKSTLGRMLARELGLLYIDTGSMYRAVALAVIESATANEQDDVAVASLAEGNEIDLGGGPDSFNVLLKRRDGSDRIRGEDVTQGSSIFLTISARRRGMVKR